MTMTTALHRPYPFSVRNLHRETSESYTRRLFAANFATDSHRRALAAAAHRELSAATVESRWIAVLTSKSGRSLTDLVEPRAWAPQHGNGERCEHCLKGIGTRLACTLCTHGDVVEQHPHFGPNVCPRHHTWIAPGTPADAQIVVSEETLQADKRFQKLVRQRRLDVPLFVLLANAASAAFALRSPSSLYPQVIALAETLTGESFGRRFFNPTQPFASSLDVLQRAIEGIWGIAPAELLAELWLRFLSSVVSLRETISKQRPYTLAAQHDIPINRNVAHNYRVQYTKGDLIELSGYRAAIQSTTPRGWTYREEHAFAPSTSKTKGAIATICDKGHRTSRLPLSPCPACTNRIVYPGYNDLETRNPDTAKEWHPTRNTMAASSVFPTSKKAVWWLCSENHDYRATPSNRTANGSNCSVCQNRVVVPGVNDLRTLHPTIAQDWRSERNSYFDIKEMAPGSNQVVWWICHSGHTYKQSIGSRVRGGGCKRCSRVHTYRVSIANGPTHLAAEWNVTANQPLTKETVTLGSRRECSWICPSGHHYTQRPERRMAGYGCPLCSGHAYERGTNDFATMFPLLATEWHSGRNGVIEASDHVARSRKIWWECSTSGHEYEQTVYHRIQSNGCPMCPPDQRAGAGTISA